MNGRTDRAAGPHTFAGEPLGNFLHASALHRHVGLLPIMTSCSPEMEHLALDVGEHCVQVPSVRALQGLLSMGMGDINTLL